MRRAYQYCSFVVRYRVAHARYLLTDRLPWALAWFLPRKVALYAFVRVYSTLGTCGDDYTQAYARWARGEGR